MSDLARDFDSLIATGTRWEVHCPCGREHHYRRPVVSVGSLNDARVRLVELAAENARLRPIVAHVAGLVAPESGFEYGEVHRQVIYDAREALTLPVRQESQ